MPGGGDCEGRTDAIMASRDTEVSLAGRKSCAASNEAKPENIGATVAGGTCGRATQQFTLAAGHGIAICAQQLCAACCAGSAHVPTENSITPIRVMATAVRWPIPRNMVSDYHPLTILP